MIVHKGKSRNGNAVPGGTTNSFRTFSEGGEVEYYQFLPSTAVDLKTAGDILPPKNYLRSR